MQPLTINVLLDALMWQDSTTIDINLVTNCDIITQHCNVLQTRPSTDNRVPADDSALDISVLLDLRVLEQHTSLKSDTIANNDIRSDCDIGTDPAVFTNLSSGMDHDVPTVEERF